MTRRVQCVVLKREADGLDRAPYPGESYRTLGIHPSCGGLKFTFGPTDYFQMVNTCEAIAAELADFVRRNPGQAPKPYLSP